MTAPDPSAIDRIIDIARGDAEPEASDLEHRTTRRFDFGGSVAFVQWTPQGGKSIATLVECKNISSSGMCIVSKYMLHVGHEGAILLRRSSGEQVMLGIKVVHCAYVGDMKHESGLEFIAVPEQFTLEDFKDENGQMPDLGQKKAA